MSDDEQQRDPQAVAKFMRLTRPLMKTYFRCETRGMANIPPGGALVVSNHSGGTFSMDLPVFMTGFVDEFGPERAMHLLAHDAILRAPVIGRALRSWGLVPASQENAQRVLSDGGVVMVFPGGDYDVARPFTENNRIDFDGRKGYVRTALAAGVPIVPCVSIGGHETQLFLSRGQRLVRLTRLDKLLRARSTPVSFGFPFGLSLAALNLPLPAKIVTSVLPAIEPTDDVEAIDAQVRKVMQAELDVLASQRRFPVIG